MRFLRTFTKRWYLYVVPIILVPVIVTVYGFNKLSVYESRATLYVDKPSFLSPEQFGWNPYLSPAQNVAEQMSELLSIKSFVMSVAQKTDLANRADLTGDAAVARISSEVSVAAPGVGPHVVVVSVTDKEPHLAQQINQVFLDVFKAYYQSHRIADDTRAQYFYQNQVQSAQSAVAQDVAKEQDYCHQHPDMCAVTQVDPTLAQLQNQLSQDHQALATSESQLLLVNQDLAATNTSTSDLFQVPDPPSLPVPSLDKKKLLTVYTGGGLAGALGFVALIVIGLTQLDRKVYMTDDLRAIQDDLELDLAGGIVALPVIAGMNQHSQEHSEIDDTIEGILVPVLTALPRLPTSEVHRELRRATGTSTAALPSAVPEEAEA
jgi:uncharacterized protein involved in exopolysaccharide biosynthesis